MINFIPPGLVLIVIGLILPFISMQARKILAIIAPIITLLLVIQIPDGVILKGEFLSYSLEIIEGDKLSRLFGIIFGIMALGGVIFAINSANL